MKGGKKYYLKKLGNVVKEEREKRGMSQIKFYKYLFPECDYYDENIKSKMNDIENAYRKNIDPDFLLALHDKCNLCLDYIFGYETDFPNYENKNACLYTGLSVETIELLHSLAVSIQTETSSLEINKNIESFRRECKLKSDKQEAAWIIMILEALLNEGRSEEDYANFSILFDLYMIAVVKPEKLHGIRLNEVNKEDDFMQIIGKSEELYVDSLTMSDSFGVAHSIDIDKIHQQIWKNKLNSDVEKFITTIQQRIIEEDTLPNRIPEHRSYTF